MNSIEEGHICRPLFYLSFIFIIFSILIFLGSSNRDTWEHGMIMISRVRVRAKYKRKEECLEREIFLGGGRPERIRGGRRKKKGKEKKKAKREGG